MMKGDAQRTSTWSPTNVKVDEAEGALFPRSDFLFNMCDLCKFSII